jgi:hypothetical protein
MLERSPSNYARGRPNGRPLVRVIIALANEMIELKRFAAHVRFES